MKFICIYLFLLLNLSNYDLSYIRISFLKAPSNEKSTKELIALTENNDEPLIRGYNGAAKIIMAKHYLNPIFKLKSFNRGKAILESAIEKDQTNPELKFLRLTIQENLPSFLNYHHNIKEDLLFIKKSLATMTDGELKKIITSYLNGTKPKRIAPK